MQKTFATRTAKQILATCTILDGRKFVTLNGTTYTVIEHERVELNNGGSTSTVVLESANTRVVLEA